MFCPCDHGRCWERWSHICGCLRSPGMLVLQASLIKRFLLAERRGLVGMAPHALGNVRLWNVSGVVSQLESWAGESALSICSLLIMNISAFRGVWNNTAVRQICSAVRHAPLSSGDIVGLSFAASSQSVSAWCVCVNTSDLRSMPATWARRGGRKMRSVHLCQQPAEMKAR